MLLKQLFHTLLCVSLTGALPTDPSLEKRCAEKWCPSVRQVVYYPTGFTQGNCSSIINPNNNPLQGIFNAGSEKDDKHNFELKRSLAPLDKRARPPNPLCVQVAANDVVNDFPNYIGNSGDMTLVGGVTYVISWAFDTAVAGLELWTSPNGNNFVEVDDRDPGDDMTAGTWEFTMQGADAQEQQAHFELFFDTPWAFVAPNPPPVGHINGHFAVFALLPEAPNELAELVRGLFW